MEDKIAVHCKTEDEWDKVRAKLGKKSCACNFKKALQNEADQSGELCLSGWGGWSSKRYYVNRGHTIISAVEYLNEGGKDVSEFKVGDRVEINNEADSNVGKTGEIYSLDHSCGEDLAHIELDDGSDVGYYLYKLTKLTKTQTKENDVKDNNINKNVQAVFGDKTGSELLLVDKHYNADVLERILMETHKDAILKACNAAEAKRLKEEAKEV